MPKASEVAAGLRKIAEALDAKPDMDMATAWLSFYCETRDHFINGASILPKPYKKGESGGNDRWARIFIEHKDLGVETKVSVYKSLTCELVEPAKPAVYRCDPILSAIEEQSLEATR